jgi:hypothetical protein
MMFLSTGVLSTGLVIATGDVNMLAFEAMGLAGFVDSVNVYAQTKEFKEEPGITGKAKKYGIMVAVLGKGAMDLFTGALAKGAMGYSPEFWTGAKFMTMGTAIGEFWNRREKDAVKENWQRFIINEIKNNADKPDGEIFLAELKKMAKENPDSPWTELLEMLKKQAEVDPVIDELLKDFE